jgi:chromate transporter
VQYFKTSKPSKWKIFKTFLKVGIIGFGGPAGQIATIHRIVVDEKKWFSEDEFLNALNYCIALPGPETHKLASYIGWLMYGTRGAIVAGFGIMIPSLFFVIFLGIIYTLFRVFPVVDGILMGAKAVVVGIVIEAVIKMYKKTGKTLFFLSITFLSFCAKFFFDLHFLIILGAGLISGFLHEHLGYGKFQSISVAPDIIPRDFFVRKFKIPFEFFEYALKVLLIWVPLFSLPFLAVKLMWGEGSVMFIQLKFYGIKAFLTVGGAYSVLVGIANDVVEKFHWLSVKEVTEILSISEAVPGPLIMFNQILSFITAIKFPESNISEGVAGSIALLLTTWITYIPSFFSILIIAPYIEFLRHNKIISKILNTITACVFGVIIEFSIWFLSSILFEKKIQISYGLIHFKIPNLLYLHLPTFFISLCAIILIFRFKVSAVKMIGIGCVLGGAYSMLKLFI